MSPHGFDERFVGWGDEDNEFFERVAARTTVLHLAYDLTHLYHPRAVMQHDGRRSNESLLRDPNGRPHSIGDPCAASLAGLIATS